MFGQKSLASSEEASPTCGKPASFCGKGNCFLVQIQPISCPAIPQKTHLSLVRGIVDSSHEFVSTH